MGIPGLESRVCEYEDLAFREESGARPRGAPLRRFRV